MARLLHDIAAEIDAEWPRITNDAARTALDAMKTMGAITDPYFADPNGYSVVSVFLEHSRGWQGTTTKRIKSELRTMCGHHRP
jgi:hypothetical protein